MKTKIMSLAAVTFLLLTGSAYANLMWKWTGDCTEFGAFPPVVDVPLCGQGTVRALTTNDYIPGAIFFGSHLDGPLLEFLYIDDNVTVDLAKFPPSDGGFLLPAVLPGEGFIRGAASLFESDVQGNWRLAGEGILPPKLPFNDTGVYDVAGINGVWTVVAAVVPLPSTLPLLAIGLVGLLSLRRRKPKLSA